MNASLHQHAPQSLEVTFSVRAHELTARVRIRGRTIHLSEDDGWILMRKVSEAIDKITTREQIKPFALNGEIVPLCEAEKAVIEHALAKEESFSETADKLGITVRTLYNRRQQYGLL